MSLDAVRLRAALDRHGAVARVVVAQARGSVPRGPGTEMLVWADGADGTIGGGALEWRAMAVAREVLARGGARVERMPLGPSLGQCCGGAVTLVVERLDAVPDLPWLRRVEGSRPAPAGDALFRDGWMREEADAPSRSVWVWGAGHVGRALVAVMAPLPDLAITWVDVAAGRFPSAREGVAVRVSADLPAAMALAPTDAEHLIVTHSHDLDLALCHAALGRGFRWCGLIGSATKWARFRSRLAGLGHPPEAIGRIACPIGDPRLGKHPQAIAVGVAAALLSARAPARTLEEAHA